jgi:methionyl-tRNA synthetase
VHYVCADDAHGTAIMLKAEQNGVTPEQQIATVKADHERGLCRLPDPLRQLSFHALGRKPRVFGSFIYLKNRDAGHIATRPIRQLFDPEKQMFLADRFIKGECPKCSAKDQYGDSCEVCGATYAPTELKNPYSTISGATPVDERIDSLLLQAAGFCPTF